jgi:hypothetical protein
MAAPKARLNRCADMLTELLTPLMLLSLQPLPRIAISLVPAAIALCAYASLKARSDDPLRAWVQLITAACLALWMLVPWHPQDQTLIAGIRSMTIFAYGYVLQDWLREAFRSGLDPRWAHRVVMASIVLAMAAMALTKLP